MLAYADETSESLAGELRPGNAGANTAADQIAVAEQAIQQIPAEHIVDIELLLPVDSAGASHELLDWCHEGRIGFSVGYDLTETVRTATLETPDSAWVCALDQDGSPRSNGQVCEITGHLDLTSWPAGSRVIVRRERAHPARSSHSPTMTGIASRRSSPTSTARSPSSSASTALDDGSRITSANDKDTGLRNLPFRDFEHNRVWLEIVRIEHDLIAWTQRLLLTGELARCEPKRLRSAAARRRPPRVPRPHSNATNTSQLALGHRSHHRVPTPQRAPAASRLIPTATPRRPASPPARRAPRSLPTHPRQTAASDRLHRNTQQPGPPRPPQLAPPLTTRQTLRSHSLLQDPG
jgi:hypothetical protein